MRLRRATSAPARSSSRRFGPGSGARTCTASFWPPASPPRRFSPTLRKPTAPAASSPNCGRCRASSRRPGRTSRSPPAILVKVGLDTWRGVKTFIDSDLPRAFSTVDDLHLLADLADASAEAVQAAGAYVDYLENDLRPRAKGSFRLGAARFEQKLRFEEGLQLPIERLLAIAMRELQATQDEFRRVAGRLNGGDPIEAWRKTKDLHPPPGTLIATAREQLNELRTFLSRTPVVGMPEGDEVTVGSTPEFFRWSFASMWTPGPFETRASRAMYYLTDADPSWPPNARLEHLRDFNTPTLWTISMHEVFPGTTSITSTSAA